MKASVGMETDGAPPYINNVVSTWNALQVHRNRGKRMASTKTEVKSVRQFSKDKTSPKTRKAIITNSQNKPRLLVTTVHTVSV